MSEPLDNSDNNHPSPYHPLQNEAFPFEDNPAPQSLQGIDSTTKQPANDLKFYELRPRTASQETDAISISIEDQDPIASMELTFDVEYDVESYLEEFSRLARKGMFDLAIELFHTYPQDLKDHPELILEFVDTLLKQGAYKSLADFAADRESGLLELLSDCEVMPIEYLRSVFELGRRHVLNFGEESKKGNARDGKLDLELLANIEKLDSIQVQLLCNIIYLYSQTEESNIPHQYTPSSLNWHHLYKHLLSTNRIWDMHDLFHALCFRYGVGDTIKLLLKNQKQDTSSKTVKSEDPEFRGWFHFVLDWTKSSHGDESTELALLDLLVTISLQLLSHSCENDEHTNKTIRQAMTHANQFAISLSLSNPQNVQTSPYLRWVLANEKLARELPLNKRQIPKLQYLKRAEGVVVWTSNLPIYVPFEVINHNHQVSWKKQSRTTSDNLLRLGLDAARENGDHALAVEYLQEMFHTSDEPIQVLNQLSHLQKDIQGDQLGYLRTCLTKFLCLSEVPDRNELFDELEVFDKEIGLSSATASREIDPITQWSKRVIETTLSNGHGQAPRTRGYLTKEEEVYEQLPYDFKRLLAELGKERDDRADVSRKEEADIKDPLPEVKEPAKTIYRDGNFIICDSSGYYSRIFPAASGEGGTK